MAVTVVGSVYNIPKLDAVMLFNEKTGSTWDANLCNITAVSTVTDADGVVVAIQVTVAAA